MKLFLRNVTIFFIIVFISFLLLDKYYTSYSLNHPNVCEKSDWILNHKNESFDFAVLGNSRVMHMVDISTIEKHTGKTGINLGIRGANFAENYLVLDQFLKKGNTIKNLAIEVNMHNLDSRKQLEYPFHDYNYVSYLKDTSVYNTFKDNVPYHKVLMWKFIPFIRYMEFSNRFSLYKIIKGGFECKINPVFDLTKGSEIVNDKVFKDEKQSYVYWKINESDEKYLDKLIDFSLKNKIHLVFYSGPVYYKYQPFQLNYKNILEQVKTKVMNKGISFINFCTMQNALCQNQGDFNDNFHMNISGVSKFSPILADSLSKYFK
ncbi:MAG: hypothetical protein JWO32_2388 [Bacteroidetes bacterium]|nr:hypothetical protein [Bacteroidota bacterium]